MPPIYLDHNATTPLDPLALEAMLPYLKDTFGNASSLHLFGQAAKKGVDEARATVAKHLGCEEKEVIFTSGATEADNHALLGAFEALRKKGNHVVISAIEHPAILNTADRLEKAGAEVTRLGVGRDGAVDLEAVRAALRSDTVLVSIMYVNNETGAIQPIPEIAELVKERGIAMHTDAVQAGGKLSLRVDELGVDLMSLSGHKIYGPKGIGVLYVRRGSFIRPLITGGHHEFNRRAGTENVAGMVGFARAFELAHQRMSLDNGRIAEIRDALQKRLLELVPHIYITAGEGRRAPNTLHVLFHFIEGEGLLLKLSMIHQIGISTGSACTSGTLEPSHVLAAMGISKQLGNSGVRISLGRGNSLDQVETIAQAFAKEVAVLRAMSPLYDAWERGKMKPADRAVYETWTTRPA
jgi:cysteine desulfurase